jgi:O-antigen/teichoic acid export membrane protein
VTVIRGIGARAVILSVTRLMNHGLVLISPIVLVRLMSVEQFGRYREFLLYSSVLITLAALGVNASLLHFVPHRPEHTNRFVGQALVLTFATSMLVIAVVVLLNVVLDGAVIGHQALPVVLYAALFVNFDFWESLWIAQKKIVPVWGYTTGRLVARLTVVITAALLTTDVDVIIWSLIALEAVRLLISAIAWLRIRGPRPAKLPGSWSDQLRFCLPAGAASVVVTLNRSMGSMFVVRLLGPVALAHYAIGIYVHPLLAVLRNSLSDALLPEMSAQRPADRNDPLFPWRRMTIVAAIALCGAAVVLARFADTVVTTLFSAQYRAAVPVFQIYMLVLLRETMDFAVPLRAVNRTAPIMYGNGIALALNALLLWLLLPSLGIPGAALAYVISRGAEGIYLALSTARAYDISPRALANWTDLLKVALAAALASITLIGNFWTDHFGLPGAIVAGLCYLLAYAGLLFCLRVPEALLLWQGIRRLHHTFQTRT